MYNYVSCYVTSGSTQTMSYSRNTDTKQYSSIQLYMLLCDLWFNMEACVTIGLLISTAASVLCKLLCEFRLSTEAWIKVETLVWDKAADCTTMWAVKPLVQHGNISYSRNTDINKAAASTTMWVLVLPLVHHWNWNLNRNTDTK